LVVRNGKHKGTRVPLKLPVTVIGHGEQCDVRLTGEGIADWHCCLAVTPAGLTVRSWHAAETLVNGEPTAAGVLNHGDALQVGPCQFRVAWQGNLSADHEPGDASADFHLKEREAALHEQERQLAGVLDARLKQVEDLFDQLDTGREELRKEKLGHKAAKDEAKRLRADAVRDRKLAGDDRAKARAVYGKFMARLKRRWAAEKNAITGGRADLFAEWERLEADREAFAAGRRAFVTDAELYKRRLADAWEMVADGHRRLLADRAAAEEAVRAQEEAIASREEAVTSAEASAVAHRDKLRAESEALLVEVTGLESRAFHLNLKVQELEQARSSATAGLAVAAAAGAETPLPAVAGPVPLDRRRDQGFDQLVYEINKKEQELAKEQQAVAKAKAAFDGIAKDLADQRAVLAEQFSKLAAAREQWHRTETVTVRELEDLARSVDRREKRVAVREQAGAKADEDRLTRQQELVQFRLKLEGWQAGLTAHEAGWYATKDSAEAELDRKREHVAKCEQALSAMAAEWAAAWKAERDGLKARYAEYLDERETLHLWAADLDRRAAEVGAQAQTVAALAVATEEAKAAFADSVGKSKAEKRVRVTRKGWEKHFARVSKDLDARRDAAHGATEKLEKKYHDLHRVLAEVAERTAAAVDKERAVDQLKAKEEREVSDRAVILSIETARRKRSELAVEELRGEVDRVAKVLLTTELSTEEVIPLAQAA
jgi:hypothetical protein